MKRKVVGSKLNPPPPPVTKRFLQEVLQKLFDKDISRFSLWLRDFYRSNQNNGYPSVISVAVGIPSSDRMMMRRYAKGGAHLMYRKAIAFESLLYGGTMLAALLVRRMSLMMANYQQRFELLLFLILVVGKIRRISKQDGSSIFCRRQF